MSSASCRWRTASRLPRPERLHEGLAPVDRDLVGARAARPARAGPRAVPRSRPAATRSPHRRGAPASCRSTRARRRCGLPPRPAPVARWPRGAVAVSRDRGYLRERAAEEGILDHQAEVVVDADTNRATLVTPSSQSSTALNPPPITPRLVLAESVKRGPAKRNDCRRRGPAAADANPHRDRFGLQRSRPVGSGAPDRSRRGG